LKDTLQSQIILTERHFQDLEMPEVKNWNATRDQAGNTNKVHGPEADSKEWQGAVMNL
jgi:hypothetical protein